MATTYEPIQSTTLSSASPTITFSSIPATYTDLRLVFVGTEVEATQITKRLRFNGDTASNYSTSHLGGNGTDTYSNQQANEAGIRLASNQYGDGSIYPIFTAIDIFSYTGSKYKSVLINTSAEGNIAVSGYGYNQRECGLWRSTSAITSITLCYLNSSTWSVGSSLTLYGIKAA